jgi:ATP-dependent helicase HrpB
MSATIAAEEVAGYLDAPIVRSEGRVFPVEYEYIDHEPDDLASDVSRAVRRAVSDDDGDVLVFLPGAREIHASAERLSGLSNIDVHTLYGAMPPEKQDAAIEPGPRQKVILSTNIAETSLTIEGVTTVVDSGRVRVPFASDSRGFDVLETRWVSLASAEQRAGRAGRVRPGRAIRLWPRSLEFRFDEYDEPEVRRIDLTSTLLEVIAWSGSDPAEFDWYERPTDAAIGRGVELLRRLGALEPDAWRLTGIGQRILELPLHPRLGRILIEADARGCGPLVARMAAVIAERDFVTRVDRSAPPADSDALVRARILDEVASGRTHGARRAGLDVHVGRARTVQRVARQIEGFVEGRAGEGSVEDALKSVLVGFPDRVCFRRRGGEAYSKSDGGAVVLGYESVVRNVEQFVALEVFGEAKRDGAAYGIARMVSRVEMPWLEEVLPDSFGEDVIVGWDAERERVTASKVRSFGGVELDTRIVSVQGEADPQRVTDILAEHAATDLVRAFGLNKDAAAWLDRVGCLARWKPELGLPEFDDESGLEIIRQLAWGKRSFAELRRIDFLGTMHGLIGHERWAAIEREAPARIKVPSGSHIRLDYTVGEPPILAVRLQEVFGWTDTPRVAGGTVEVLMHLLAPNYRPVQVTQDLASFWETTYPEVRKELRARYSKHPWPEDPWNAKAIRK